MNNLFKNDVFKKAYLQLILQSIKNDCIIQLQKKNIENPDKIINDTFKSLNLSIDPSQIDPSQNDPSKPKKQKALLHWLRKRNYNRSN